MRWMCLLGKCYRLPFSDTLHDVVECTDVDTKSPGPGSRFWVTSRGVHLDDALGTPLEIGLLGVYCH